MDDDERREKEEEEEDAKTRDCRTKKSRISRTGAAVDALKDFRVHMVDRQNERREFERKVLEKLEENATARREYNEANIHIKRELLDVFKQLAVPGRQGY